MEKSNEQLNYEKFMVQFQDYYEEYMDENEVFTSFYAYSPLSDNYWKITPKILVYNLEPYDEREGTVIVDINLYKEWIKVPTGLYTAKFITGLIKKIKEDDLNELIKFETFCNHELLDYMKNIAYMNFRLSSNSVVLADKKGIMNDVNSHPDYLVDQIKSLCPDIIIIGGEIGCNAFNKLFNTTLEFDSTIIIDNKVICSIKNFSRADYKYYNEKVNNIITCLKSIK